MAEPRENQLIRQLSEELVAALVEARKSPRTLSSELIAQTLAQRPLIIQLVKDFCHNPEGETTSEPQNQGLIALQGKYNKLADDLRYAENHSREVEESFRQLTLALTALADDQRNQERTKQLEHLRQVLKQRIVPSRLDGSTKTIKDQVFRMTGERVSDREEGKKVGFFRGLLRKEAGENNRTEAGGLEGFPENVEETIRDILKILIEDISSFEDKELQKRAALLVRRIKSEFTIQEYKPFVQEIQELIFQLKDAIHRNKKELIQFTQEVMANLEDTEKDFVRNLDTEAELIGTKGVEFERQLTGDIKVIEEHLEDSSLNIEELRGKIIQKIQGIRLRFKAKRAQDEARLKQLEEEKHGTERRLNDINNRYQNFTTQSKLLFEEMEKFKNASLTDSLTGASNRRAYDLEVDQALDSLKKDELLHVSLIVFDIDHFKEFNNTYGHRAGDKILQNVAKFTKEFLRKDDFVARYGGDEFAVILPEVTLQRAASMAEELRARVSGIQFKLYKERDLTVQVGLSMGVGEGRKSDTPDSIFRRADEAMYRAKENGRNQVCTETPSV